MSRLPNLPSEITGLIGLNLSAKEIRAFCDSRSEFANFCTNETNWYLLLIKKYPWLEKSSLHLFAADLSISFETLLYTLETVDPGIVFLLESWGPETLSHDIIGSYLLQVATAGEIELFLLLVEWLIRVSPDFNSDYYKMATLNLLEHITIEDIPLLFNWLDHYLTQEYTHAITWEQYLVNFLNYGFYTHDRIFMAEFLKWYGRSNFNEIKINFSLVLYLVQQDLIPDLLEILPVKINSYKDFEPLLEYAYQTNNAKVLEDLIYFLIEMMNDDTFFYKYYSRAVDDLNIEMFRALIDGNPDYYIDYDEFEELEDIDERLAEVIRDRLMPEAYEDPRLYQY